MTDKALETTVPKKTASGTVTISQAHFLIENETLTFAT